MTEPVAAPIPAPAGLVRLTRGRGLKRDSHQSTGPVRLLAIDFQTPVARRGRTATAMSTGAAGGRRSSAPSSSTDAGSAQ
jgi:hypothetical protein